MKWTYVAKGHYSTPDDKGGTVHVAGGAVYITHPKRATVDVTGVKADRYIASATGKRPVKPKPMPGAKPPTKKKQPRSKLAFAISKAKQIGTTAKPVVSAAFKAGAAVSSVGEMVASETHRADVGRTPPPRTPRQTSAATEHPLAYLTGPPSTGPDISYLTDSEPHAHSRRGKVTTSRRRREQTLEEFMGWK